MSSLLINRISSLATSIGADIKSLFANKMDKTAIIPNANLSGVYTKASIKTDGSNTVFSVPSSGTTSSAGRSVNNIAEYRGLTSTTGHIVVNTTIPKTRAVMKRLHIKGFNYTNNRIIDLIVCNYHSNPVLNYQTYKVSRGDTDIPVRFAVNPYGNICMLLGDITTVWSYPHFSIDAMLSHAVSDEHCKGWTVDCTTDLTDYALVTNPVPIQPLDTVIDVNKSVTSIDISKVVTDNGIKAGQSLNSYKKGWRKLTATLPSTTGEIPVHVGFDAGISMNVGMVCAKAIDNTGRIVFNNDPDVTRQFYVRLLGNGEHIILGLASTATKILGAPVTIYIDDDIN